LEIGISFGQGADDDVEGFVSLRDRVISLASPSTKPAVPEIKIHSSFDDSARITGDFLGRRSGSNKGHRHMELLAWVARFGRTRRAHSSGGQ
jgi:hypothetical protein